MSLEEETDLTFLDVEEMDLEEQDYENSGYCFDCSHDLVVSSRPCTKCKNGFDYSMVCPICKGGGEDELCDCSDETCKACDVGKVLRFFETCSICFFRDHCYEYCTVCDYKYKKTCTCGKCPTCCMYPDFCTCP